MGSVTRKGKGATLATALREGQPSFTARMVAIARGLGTQGPVPDPVASSLLPEPVSGILERANSDRWTRGILRPAARVLSLGLVDHVTLRTAAIDAALVAALANGIDQVVILGAGLDARAHRLSCLGASDVFEIDHPATQAYKRRNIGARVPLARSLHYVPVNFESQRLGNEMAASDHDAKRPTFWIWEGVTMYLNELATVATLGEIASRSSEGSRLAVTYALPELVSLGRLARAATRTLFSSIGEPLRGAHSMREMNSLLEGASFRMISDTDGADWAVHHGGSFGAPFLFRGERLAIAAYQPR